MIGRLGTMSTNCAVLQDPYSSWKGSSDTRVLLNPDTPSNPHLSDCAIHQAKLLSWEETLRDKYERSSLQYEDKVKIIMLCRRLALE